MGRRGERRRRTGRETVDAAEPGRALALAVELVALAELPTRREGEGSARLRERRGRRDDRRAAAKGEVRGGRRTWPQLNLGSRQLKHSQSSPLSPRPASQTSWSAGARRADRVGWATHQAERAVEPIQQTGRWWETVSSGISTSQDRTSSQHERNARRRARSRRRARR